FTHAKASFQSRYGLVSSAWKKEGETYSFDIVIPPNCQARIVLPNGTIHEVEAGAYHF
ncbi:MAG: hypothetical protein HUJ60_06090, partial [Bacilli bacterium]|nr:hypothetical protein [Bacilli bacterium]